MLELSEVQTVNYSGPYLVNDGWMPSMCDVCENDIPQNKKAYNEDESANYICIDCYEQAKKLGQ